MGCGCGGVSASAQQFVIKFADGTISSRYDSEADARVALARTGKTGVVKPVSR